LFGNTLLGFQIWKMNFDQPLSAQYVETTPTEGPCAYKTGFQNFPSGSPGHQRTPQGQKNGQQSKQSFFSGVFPS
jgi:hypothetical protein